MSDHTYETPLALNLFTRCHVTLTGNDRFLFTTGNRSYQASEAIIDYTWIPERAITPNGTELLALDAPTPSWMRVVCRHIRKDGRPSAQGSVTKTINLNDPGMDGARRIADTYKPHAPEGGAPARISIPAWMNTSAGAGNPFRERVERTDPVVRVFDTETTGTGPDDEVLALAITDEQGRVLFNHRFKPVTHTAWPEAQKIHGITPEDVADEKPLYSYKTELDGIFRDTDVLVGYNLRFDERLLEQSGYVIRDITNAPWRSDVMLEYAPIAAVPDTKHNGFKYQKLVDCATHYGYRFHAHDALEDTKATAYCWLRMGLDQRFRALKDATVNTRPNSAPTGSDAVDQPNTGE
ncbi:hypothetical protein CSQ85_11935 [Bifidobacterium rousetti]|uniref:3'-5' exonuclease n=1 Tax=Bifidobacterium rousetti TaxID=2045439 RepID=UPI00123B2F58|nr:3'-5' exonuclease [Bifidobacterium rousetti]KAA8816127.1 hypothetical protein CSQ85_11935 [Bifidobacterium rousetti]